LNERRRRKKSRLAVPAAAPRLAPRIANLASTNYMTRTGGMGVPLYRLLQERAFGPEAVVAMTAAYDHVLRELKLVDSHDPLTEIVARRIIDYAAAGERDPIRIRDGVLHEFNQQPARSPPQAGK
jgi:hypothetical protein